MDLELKQLLLLQNPWLQSSKVSVTQPPQFLERQQTQRLLKPEWDRFWLILVGPRQSGKTTLGMHLCQLILEAGRYEKLLYLNCDFLEIRNWLKSPAFLQEAKTEFSLEQPILFIDEVQRLDNPGLLLKGIIDLPLSWKWIASGSSQLEIKSKVQEHLTGRHIENVILPLSYYELGQPSSFEEFLIWGMYPQVVTTTEKETILAQLYQDYISKDIIEILKVNRPDVMQRLITLLAHSTGQLVNYQQLATDLQVSVPTVQSYTALLEATYVIASIRPFVGNKRTEVTSNPVYYFIDNGFRNQALRYFSGLAQRQDAGDLVEGAVFQELLKWKYHHNPSLEIRYWRTKSGAEVDFVVFQNEQNPIPIEVKYRRLQKGKVTRGFRSFLQAYRPTVAVYITHSYIGQETIEETLVHFIPFSEIHKLWSLLKDSLIMS